MKVLSGSLVFVLTSSLLTATPSADEPACKKVFRDRYVEGWETSDTVRVIGSPITIEGELNCSYYPDREQRLNLRVIFETGRYEGVEYHIYHNDGSGTIQGHAGEPLDTNNYANNWHLSCRSMPGAQPGCRLHKHGLTISQPFEGPPGVVVGEQWLPGSDILIRVDQNWAMTADAGNGLSGQQIRGILQQLKTGSSVDIRFHHRDNQKPTYRTFSLYGFNQAMAIMHNVMEQVSRASRQDSP